MATLLMKFSGPLQSWGSSSKFETRHTEKYPTKSGVIGLIAGSMGLRRNDQSITSLNQINLAIRIDQPGNIIHDYHIASKYKANGEFDRNYVTNRYYIEDAIFLVGIESDDLNEINDIHSALKKPYFQPFLGRRANVITADFVQGIFEEPLMQVLREYPWQASKWFKKSRKDMTHLEIIADAPLLKNESKTIFMRDSVESFSQDHRKYNFRTVAQSTIPNPDIPGAHEHDVFQSFGKED